jgi:hypothetical protein
MALKWQHKTRAQLRQGFGLTAGGATGSGDKTFDDFRVGDVRGGLVVHGGSKKFCPLCLRR